MSYTIDNDTVIVRAWLGSYANKTSLDGSYGWVIADEFKKELCELFVKISDQKVIEHIDHNNKIEEIEIASVADIKYSKIAKLTFVALGLSILTWLYCVFLGWSGIFLIIPLFIIAIKGLKDRVAKIPAIFTIVILCWNLIWCVLRTLVQIGVI